MVKSFRFMRYVVLSAMLLAVVACSMTPVAPLSPPQAITSFQAVAGEWKGTITAGLNAATFSSTNAHVRLTMKPDGSFTSTVNGMPGQGTAQLRDGKIVYEGSSSRGTASLHERAGQPVLRGEGTLVGMTGWSAFEVTR